MFTKGDHVLNALFQLFPGEWIIKTQPFLEILKTDLIWFNGNIMAMQGDRQWNIMVKGTIP